MKTETKELLGFNVPVVGIVETIAEAVSASGSEEAVLKDYNNYVLYHSHYTLLRRAIVKKLVELTGIKLKTTKDGEKEVIDETDGAYRARLEEELGEEVLASYEAQIAEACSSIKVDYTPGVRGAGASAKPAAKWLNYWDEAKNQGKLDAYLSKFGIDTTKPEEEQKIDFANAVKAKVTAAMQAAAKTALA